MGGCMGFRAFLPMVRGRGWLYVVQGVPSNAQRAGVGIWGSNWTLQCVDARGGYMGFKPDPPMCRGRGWVYGVESAPSKVWG